VSTSIHELLDDLRARALDERDKGDKFEQLIRAYLTTDPEWTARFSDVWLWSEPGSADEHLSGRPPVTGSGDVVVGQGLSAGVPGVSTVGFRSGRWAAGAVRWWPGPAVRRCW